MSGFDLAALRVAIAGGVAALCRHQSPAGYWQDYDLPVGASDEWVTALIALCLAETASAAGLRTARAAAAAGLTALTANRSRAAGYGYNALVDADADSTATVLLLGQTLEMPPDPADVGFLAGHLRPDGGIATFSGPDGWGQSHSCVTPVAGLALCRCSDVIRAETLLRHADRIRGTDGFWPAYWWQGPFYATAAWLRFAEAVGSPFPAPVEPAQHPISTAMDLALAIEIAGHWQPDAVTTLAQGLLSCQLRDGRWPASRSLRVTDFECCDPATASGATFADTAGLVTTAFALRALSRLRPRSDEQAVEGPHLGAP